MQGPRTVMQCVGFMFVVLVCQIACVCLMEPLSSWGNPSCSFNSTDLRRKQSRGYYACVCPVRAQYMCVFVRVMMRSADLCCFHGDWFPSRVRGPNHRQRSLFPHDPTPFHFSISLSSTAAACFFHFSISSR